ncbi:hypothetical protein B5X24_HaOG211480 [Helicoverpa armigera]|nr:hypothetical protein B5X24_HaOG211480 [Helicoverpa armigera]
MAPPEHREARRPMPSSIRRHTQEYGLVRGPNLGRLTVQTEKRRCHPKATEGHCAAGGKGVPYSELCGGVRSGGNPSLGARGLGACQSVRLEGGTEGSRPAPGPNRTGRSSGGSEGGNNWALGRGPCLGNVRSPDVGCHRACPERMARSAARVPLDASGAGAVRAWLLRIVPAPDWEGGDSTVPPL